MSTYYELLGVEPDATKDQIKLAYREKVDAARDSGDGKAAQRLNEAWHVLSDPYQRSRYDTKVAAGEEIDLTEVDERAETVEPTEAARPAPKGLFAKLMNPDVARSADRAGGTRSTVGPTGADLGLPSGLEPAPTGRRVMGVLIDGIGYLALFVICGYLAVIASGAKFDKDGRIIGGNGTTFTLVSLLGFTAVYLLMEVIPTMRRGQTVGRRIARVRVVDRESGALPSLRQAFQRAMLPLAVFLAATTFLGPQNGGMLALIIVLSGLFTKTRQSWHDRWAGTFVVDVPKDPSAPRGRFSKT